MILKNEIWPKDVTDKGRFEICPCFLSFKKMYLFLIYVYECFACINLCVSCAHSVGGDQQRASDPVVCMLSPL